MFGSIWLPFQQIPENHSLKQNGRNVKLITHFQLSSRLMCGAISPRRMCLRVVHIITLNLLPQTTGSELYVACRDEVHSAVLLSYVLTMFKTLLFGTCRTLIKFRSRKPTDKTKYFLGKTEESDHELNLYNQLLMHQNMYTSDVSKSPTCFDKS
jgi:hypothetical protein